VLHGKTGSNSPSAVCNAAVPHTHVRVCVFGVLFTLRWDFRRIEDICWIKTNRRRDTEPDRKYLSAQHQEPNSTLVHTKVCVFV
jgi:hypothetical protein